MEDISLHNSNYQWQIVFDWCLAFPSKCLILLPLRRLQLHKNVMVKINFFVLDITCRSSNYLSFLTKANRKQEYVASGCYFYKRPEWSILFENHIYVLLIANPYILLAQNDTVIETLEYHVTPTDVVFCLHAQFNLNWKTSINLFWPLPFETVFSLISCHYRRFPKTVEKRELQSENWR